MGCQSISSTWPRPDPVLTQKLFLIFAPKSMWVKTRSLDLPWFFNPYKNRARICLSFLLHNMELSSADAAAPVKAQ